MPCLWRHWIAPLLRHQSYSTTTVDSRCRVVAVVVATSTTADLTTMAHEGMTMMAQEDGTMTAVAGDSITRAEMMDAEWIMKAKDTRDMIDAKRNNFIDS